MVSQSTYVHALSQTIGLALYCLKELLLEDVVGGVEGHTHALTAGGGHGEGVRVTTAYHVHGDPHTFSKHKRDS